MDKTIVALIVAMIAAATTSLGWIVVHLFTRKREIEAREFIAKREENGREIARAQADRTRRIEIQIKYYERQVQEFYGPLYSNIQFIRNVSFIRRRFEGKISEDDMKKMQHVLRVKYYLPLHIILRDILGTKLYLMKGVEIPKSFTDYLEHSVMQEVQLRLSEEDGIDTSSVPGVEWPPEFLNDVKAGLDQAMRSYDEIIQELANPDAVTTLAGPAIPASRR